MIVRVDCGWPKVKCSAFFSTRDNCLRWIQLQCLAASVNYQLKLAEAMERQMQVGRIVVFVFDVSSLVAVFIFVFLREHGLPWQPKRA